MRRTLAILLMIAAAALGFGGQAASAAPAIPAGAAAAAAITPDFTCSTCNIIEAASPGWAVGAPDWTAGHPVTQESVGRTMTWVQQTTYLGFDAGFWKFGNGNYMAANTSCSGVTIKSSNTSSGVVWFMVPKDTANHIWYVGNRYCDNAQRGDMVLAGDGVLHHQFYIRQIGANDGSLLRMFVCC